MSCPQITQLLSKVYLQAQASERLQKEMEFNRHSAVAKVIRGITTKDVNKIREEVETLKVAGKNNKMVIERTTQTITIMQDNTAQTTRNVCDMGTQATMPTPTPSWTVANTALHLLAKKATAWITDQKYCTREKSSQYIRMQ